MDKVPNRKTESVIFSCPMLSLLDFLTLEDGTAGCPDFLKNYHSTLCNISQKITDLT